MRKLIVIFVFAVSLFCFGQIFDGPVKTYYITIGSRFENANDCTVPALKVQAHSVIEAMVKTGMTVWPEAHYENAAKRQDADTSWSSACSSERKRVASKLLEPR